MNKTRARLRRSRTLGLILLTAGGLAMAGCADNAASSSGGGDTMTLSFAHYLGPNGAQSQSVQGWADRVHELTDGEVTIEFFYSESLLKATDILPGVGDARADIGYTGALYHPNELVLSNMAEIPFLTTNVDAQIKAHYELYNSGGIMQEEFNSQGVHALLFNVIGSNIIGSKEPIDEVSDLDGLSVRSTGRVAEAYEMVGANAVALTSPEMYEALERGTIDAYSSFPMEIISDFGLPEVAPYLSMPGLGNYTQSVTVINLDVWESLPEDVREAIDQASQEYTDNAVAEYLIPVEDATCEDIKENDGEVIIWDESEVDAFAGIIGDTFRERWLDDAAKKWDRSAVEDQLEEYEALLTAYDDESDYVPGALRCAEQG